MRCLPEAVFVRIMAFLIGFHKFVVSESTVLLNFHATFVQDKIYHLIDVIRMIVMSDIFGHDIFCNAVQDDVISVVQFFLYRFHL